MAEGVCTDTGDLFGRSADMLARARQALDARRAQERVEHQKRLKRERDARYRAKKAAAREAAREAARWAAEHPGETPPAPPAPPEPEDGQLTLDV
ncbi:hypothetical protein CLBKND_04833 [Methylorubrum aminovorans]